MLSTSTRGATRLRVRIVLWKSRKGLLQVYLNRTAVRLWTAVSRLGHHNHYMSGNSFRFDSLVGELRNQGLIVTVHSASNKTWYVKGDGIYVGYVVTEDELASLKRENRLDLQGVRSLG